MQEVLKLFDYYQRNARLYPALLAGLPLVVIGLVLFPANRDAIEKVGSVLAAFGGLYWLSDIARWRGRALQDRLLRSWGGWPSTIFLRRSDGHLSPSTKERYSAFLRGRLGEAAIPTPEEELADPSAADERYGSCVEWLKEQTRGDEFALLLKENATYGFRRNLLGLKPFGVVISLGSCLAPPIVRFVVAGGNVDWPSFLLSSYSDSATTSVASAVCIGALASWLLLVRSSWVRAAADVYATTLLACCDKLGSDGSAPKGESRSGGEAQNAADGMRPGGS